MYNLHRFRSEDGNSGLISKIRNLLQREVSLFRPTKIIIVWAKQSCRTGCDYDSQFVKECK
jgi:hypothetical protein